MQVGLDLGLLLLVLQSLVLGVALLICELCRMLLLVWSIRPVRLLLLLLLLLLLAELGLVLGLVRLNRRRHPTRLFGHTLAFPTSLPARMPRALRAASARTRTLS
jgi:hypothetical protein